MTATEMEVRGAGIALLGDAPQDLGTDQVGCQGWLDKEKLDK